MFLMFFMHWKEQLQHILVIVDNYVHKGMHGRYGGWGSFKRSEKNWGVVGLNFQNKWEFSEGLF